MGLRRTAAVLSLLLSVPLAACRSREPIPVGMVSGTSGRSYSLGMSARNGATLAVEELNQAGGIAGRPVLLLTRDDEQRPEAARRAVEELSAQGVVAVVGPVTSAMAEEMLPVAAREVLLLLSPTVSSSRLLGRDDPLIMLTPSTGRSARALAGHLVRKGLARRVVSFFDLSNRAYAESFEESFRAVMTEAGSRVKSVPFTSEQGGSLARVVASALEPDTDAVLVVANTVDTASFCQQVRKRSPHILLLAADWGFTGDLVASGGRAVEGILFTQRMDLESRGPPLARFREAYQARFGAAMDFAAVASYEAVQVLASGLRRDPTRQGIRRAILEIGAFQTLTGELRIDRFGDVERASTVVMLRDGKPVIAE